MGHDTPAAPVEREKVGLLLRRWERSVILRRKRGGSESRSTAACVFAPGRVCASRREDASDNLTRFATAGTLTRQCVWTLAILILAGCGGAQIDWSPDGTRAVYLEEKKAVLIDDSGKVLSPLGGNVEAAVWSGDSKSLYFAAQHNPEEKIPAMPRLQTALLPDEMLSPTSIPAPDTNPQFVSIWTVSVLKADKQSPLFSLPTRGVQAVRLSPDQNWLAMLVADATSERNQLFVYDIPDNDLYQVSTSCGTAFCFTGPNRLAYVEPDQPGVKNDQMSGKFVEIPLARMSGRVERSALFAVLPSQTIWAQPFDNDILFTARACAYPGRISDSSEKNATFKLFRYTRANGAIDTVADDIGALFAPSPDGKHILYEKITPATDKVPVKRELAVMNANGSNPHSLRDVTIFDGAAPLWPAWRGNDQVTFIPPVDPKAVPDDEGKIYFDVTQYHLTDAGELEFVKTLSDGWKDLRPSFKVPNAGDGK